MLRIELTRDSVCMGDDWDAPHFLEIELPNTATIQNLIDAVDRRFYLAKVAGLNHSWILLVNGSEVTTLRGNSMKIWDNSTVNLSQFSSNGIIKVHFKYVSSRT